ncbi:MAG: patatin-like phospholipase family protein [Hyphomonadaceae bacterium]|nr:patatin-like phospholipase family protein [Hyphomonadaceae bacterium]
MARTLDQHLAPDGGPKRILALDGGGVKGVLSLGMAKALETELRRRSGDPALVLSDYYDLIGGTSTGAILATGLALGLTVDALIDLYMDLGPRVFGRRVGDGNLFRSRYNPKDLRAALEPTFGIKTLGSRDLRTGLALHMKRIDTGSAWVVTNNPRGPYYGATNPEHGVDAKSPAGRPRQPSESVPNRMYHLIDLVMASAAAPTFFDEVVIDIARDERDKVLQRGYFVDGAVGANNNPSMQLLLLALVPAYGFHWWGGEANLMMTSIGTGQRRPQIDGRKFQNLAPGFRGIQALRSMIYDTQIQGVMMLQALSRPKRPWHINSEVGDMGTVVLGQAPLLDYQRIDVILDVKPRKTRGETPARTGVETLLDMDLTAKELLRMDELANGSPRNMALLRDLGMAVGARYVDATYPDARFDLPGWPA